MKKIPTMLPLIVLLLSSVACAHARPAKKATAPKPSGIYGKLVQIGFPPEHEYMGQEMLLSRMPVVVLDIKDEHEIKRAFTDEKGMFRIALPPGTYYVEPTPPTPDPYGMRYVRKSRKTVKVRAGIFVETKAIYDAGW